MKNFLKSVIAAVLSLPLSVAAETVAVVPGTLGTPDAVIDPSATVLTLTGQVNAADLSYVASTAKGLELLDLSGVEIVAYKGLPLAGNITSAPTGELPAYALSGLKARRVVLPEGLASIGDGALMGSSIESIDIPASVKSMGRGAFAACTSLKAITVPATVESVGSHLCDGCTALESVEFGPADIPSAAFRDCTALSSVSFPPSLLTVGDDAFMGCVSLNEVLFPPTLASIGSGAFERSGVRGITLTYCHDLRKIGSRAFSLCPELTIVKMPSMVADMGDALFFDCPRLATVWLPGSLSELPALTLKGASGIVDAEKLLPPTVRSIGALAMAGMNNAESVNLPSSLSYIGDNAFEAMTGLSQIDARELDEVPDLGSDVWAGVDQSNVALRVKPDLVNAFISAPQWKEFSISESGSTLITENVASGSYRLRFEAKVLVVESAIPVASAVLAEIDGTVVARIAPETPVESFSFDTSSREDRLYILAMAFEDGSESAVKLLRP